ncbi:MAG TPA: hypothetical protein VFC19_47990 [Candidatus Limnocylindrales bacterium]|nr:hypothetical protein [Candidatus Limnocylindrales bacterium]
MRAALRADALVRSVDLVGSRANGTATALSDWDYHVSSPGPATVSLRLPDLTRPLRPLSALWDPLARHPVYMLIVPAGPHVAKVDLLLDLPERRPSAQPPKVSAATLPGIDAHFWDWNLWLGSKRLRGTDPVVRTELAKMWDYLLKPLGGSTAPTTQREAIIEYLWLRPLLQQRHNIRLAPDLGRAVQATLAAHGLL